MNYEEAVSELKEAGFTSIEATAVEDITSDGKIADGAIDTILIDESSEFSSEEDALIHHELDQINTEVDTIEDTEDYGFERT